MPNKIEINFTETKPLLEATISLDGKKVCVLYSCAPEQNELVKEAVKGAKDAIVKSIVKRSRA